MEVVRYGTAFHPQQQIYFIHSGKDTGREGRRSCRIFGPVTTIPAAARSLILLDIPSDWSLCLVRAGERSSSRDARGRNISCRTHHDTDTLGKWPCLDLSACSLDDHASERIK